MDRPVTRYLASRYAQQFVNVERTGRQAHFAGGHEEKFFIACFLAGKRHQLGDGQASIADYDLLTCFGKSQ
ncbi:MAG: hypothetical protein DMG96_20290 [Acidobacteria bacterium]|nr:MAG: hypothetical protein DMG96_20290 [Acidobacteriota bacterium]